MVKKRSKRGISLRSWLPGTLRVPSSGTRLYKRRMRRYTRSSESWIQDADEELHTVYHKILLSAAEQIWFATVASDVSLTRNLVPGHQHTPSYQKGTWDGMATFARFPKSDKDLEHSFRALWWH